jgi:ubiquinone/menaquinone biosynthesis C-methylase UbiE
MRLTNSEFWGMNTGIRRFFQRRLEFPVFRWLGLSGQDQDILEIGCGSGYGAVLLSQLRPKSYVGIDLMPEMIELAKQRSLPNAEFLVMDAANLSDFPDASKDLVVIFGILHHIPAWREVLDECHRVLRPGGKTFLEEPAARAVRIWDFFFRWNHPPEALFSRTELENQLEWAGFSLARRIGIPGFWSYCVTKNLT